MRVKGKGSTLIEVLIAGGLFVLVLVLVGQLTLAAYSTHARTTSKNQVLRDGTIVLDRLNRELRMSSRIYMPDLSVPETPHHMGGAGDGPLVFVTYSSRSTPPVQVVGYRYDQNARTLQRLVYDPGFDPTAPATHLLQEDPDTVATWVEDVRFRRVAPSLSSGAPLLKVEIDLSSRSESDLGTRTIGTGTRVKSL